MRWFVLVCLATVIGTDRPPSVKDPLTFLTRQGCVNTPEMEINLDDALRALKLRQDYTIVNIGTLAPTDPRTGYPTPTLLWKGTDIFGMPVPKPPFDKPS